MTSADRATLDRILRDYAGFAHRLAASYEADAETARDLTQEILMAVWRAWPRFLASGPSTRSPEKSSVRCLSESEMFWP